MPPRMGCQLIIVCNIARKKGFYLGDVLLTTFNHSDGVADPSRSLRRNLTFGYSEEFRFRRNNLSGVFETGILIHRV
jgi:hypothetical protein